eukprot:TRINITY_DN24313_c0_g1_i1.p1 TRINITY_DN24313_c0_g1~~TRINITY_DN24313_c0_g1_i1.p1  ORF type:complete len:124 (+),score=5.68 TRINITY_DN24313_c0_g1_i1:70-441(+)
MTSVFVDGVHIYISTRFYPSPPSTAAHLHTIKVVPRRTTSSAPASVAKKTIVFTPHPQYITMHYIPTTMTTVIVVVLVLSLIHISEPTRLLSISYAVFCLKKKKITIKKQKYRNNDRNEYCSV